MGADNSKYLDMIFEILNNMESMMNQKAGLNLVVSKCQRYIKAKKTEITTLVSNGKLDDETNEVNTRDLYYNSGLKNAQACYRRILIDPPKSLIENFTAMFGTNTGLEIIKRYDITEIEEKLNLYDKNHTQTEIKDKLNILLNEFTDDEFIEALKVVSAERNLKITCEGSKIKNET